jgi:hypothetical protein
MSVGSFFAKVLAKRFKMLDAHRFGEMITKVGQPSSVAVPPDLLPMVGKMLTRAAANQLAFSISRDWVLPFWAERQFTPDDPAFIPRMGWTSFNMSHRNWTAVGNLDSEREPTVDPRGLVTPWLEGWSVDFWLNDDTNWFFPSKMPDDAVTQKAVGQIPIIETTFKADTAILACEVFAERVHKVDTTIIRTRITNTSDRLRTFRLVAAIRPYNPEGLSPVDTIDFRDDEMFYVNDRVGLYCQDPPARVFATDFRTGDCSHFLDACENKKSVHCPIGLAGAYALYNLQIEPGQSVERIFAAPTTQRKRWATTKKSPGPIDVKNLREKAVAKWQQQVEKGMQISVPDDRVQKAFDQNKSYLNLLDDGHCITPGVSIYHHYWFRDSAYMVAALGKMGYTDQALEKLKNYPSRQRKDGFYLSQDGEWDSNGQAIWTLVEHFRMTGDRPFLTTMYGSIARGARWLHKKTAETQTEASPHFGLLPAGFSAEHLGPNDYFYWDDFWALAGLRDAAYAAKTLGHQADQKEFLEYYDRLDNNVRASLTAVEKRLGQKVMPASPYRRFDAGAIGCACVVHPLKLMSPQDPWAKNTFDMLREKCFYKDGFFQDMVHSGVNVYLSLHVAQGYAAMGDPVAWDIADYVLSLATDTITWPEAVNVNTGGGAMGDGLHGWAVADFLLFCRNTLINETDDTLVITPCIPSSWYDWGQKVEVKNAPTHFGNVSFCIDSGHDQITLTLDAHWRTQPKAIIWNVPFSHTRLMLDDQETEFTEGKIEFSPLTRKIQIGRKP